MQVSDDRFQAGSGWNILTLLGIYSRKLLMMGGGDARNM
jgi:hypothetical protein